MSEKRLKYYMNQLMNKIAYMHCNGIFHSGIKPENIRAIPETCPGARILFSNL